MTNKKIRILLDIWTLDKRGCIDKNIHHIDIVGFDKFREQLPAIEEYVEKLVEWQETKPPEIK